MEKMCCTTAGDDARGSLKPEPTEVYQEASLNLRHKRVTAMTARKLERTMTLLHLKPCRLIKCGLVHKSSSEQGWKRSGNKEKRQLSPSEAANLEDSVKTAVSCVQKGSSETKRGHDDTQPDQDDGWSVYEGNYHSDSDIDDDDDQDDEIEERRKGPIYAFLVYGGVQLRPDEYVLLFRALGVSPEYVEQLQREADMKPRKAPSIC